MLLLSTMKVGSQDCKTVRGNQETESGLLSFLLYTRCHQTSLINLPFPLPPFSIFLHLVLLFLFPSLSLSLFTDLTMLLNFEHKENSKLFEGASACPLPFGYRPKY